MWAFIVEAKRSYNVTLVSCVTCTLVTTCIFVVEVLVEPPKD